MFNTPTTLPDFEMISICIVLVWPVFKLPAIRCLIRTVSFHWQVTKCLHVHVYALANNIYYIVLNEEHQLKLITLTQVYSRYIPVRNQWWKEFFRKQAEDLFN